ncbi:hypothetical protein PIB30_073353 [Stylosanthes scabra]|uniref:Uncharacterized protein n=1 Tax=Stylosanthes scabra TaxID=79078 RepID=A0ABU6ZN39_9FABA|nr:hypothetical protein [Stylosanthes scabra]
MRGNHPSLPSPIPLTYPSYLPCPPCICVIPTHMRGNLTLSPIQSICYPLTTHMRAFLRIRVGDTHSHPTLHLTQPAHSFPKHSLSPCICVQSYAYALHTHSPSPLKTHSTNPSHVLSPYHPRICVQPYAYAWNSHTSFHLPSPNTPITHAYAYNSTHMRGTLDFTARLAAHIGHPLQLLHSSLLSYTFSTNITIPYTSNNHTFHTHKTSSPTPTFQNHSHSLPSTPAICTNPRIAATPHPNIPYPCITQQHTTTSPLFSSCRNLFPVQLVLEDKHIFKFGVRLRQLLSSINYGIIIFSLCFDNHRFKSAFNEELYNTMVKNKKVIAKCCIDLDEDEYPEVKEQITLRGWRRLLAPKQEISIDLIHEFYANAVVTEEEMEEAGGHTFRSFVRGVPVDFSPENIRIVMRFRAQVQGATTDFETRKEHNQ